MRIGHHAPANYRIYKLKYFKGHYDQILKFSNLHFRTRQVFPKDTVTAKFQAITIIRTRIFWPIISENLRPPLIFHVPVLVENLRKWCHFLKTTTRDKLTISIDVENCTKISAIVFCYSFWELQYYENFVHHCVPKCKKMNLENLIIVPLQQMRTYLPFLQ